MIWILRLLFAIAFLVFFDLIYGVFGLIFTRVDPIKHPRLYRTALRSLAMSEIFSRKYLPSRCVYDCTITGCGNWTCPKYEGKNRKVCLLEKYILKYMARKKSGSEE